LQNIISNIPQRSRKEVPFCPKFFPLKRNLKTLLDKKRKRRDMVRALAAGREFDPGL
jgi:hypothetical protein